jgi:hypothetical protein
MDPAYRSSTNFTNFTPTTSYPFDWTMPDGFMSGFTSTNYPGRTTGYSPNLSCPGGWALLNYDAWLAILGHFSGALGEHITSANHFTISTSDHLRNAGLIIEPDGQTCTLFLPSAGYRANDGAYRNVENVALYWLGNYSDLLGWKIEWSNAGNLDRSLKYRSYGASARCIGGI